MNEIFLPKGAGWDPNDFNLWLFDRWGNMIYHNVDMNKGWDGKANGGKEIAQEDVYIWKVELKDIFGKSHAYKGILTLVK